VRPPSPGENHTHRGGALEERKTKFLKALYAKVLNCKNCH